MFKSKTTQRNIIIIITMFMSKLLNKLPSTLSPSCVRHKLIYELSPSSNVYGKTAKLLNILSQWMSQLTPMGLQSSIAFRKHQVTQYIISHACPAKTHKDATMAKDCFHWERRLPERSTSSSQNDVETWTAHCKGCSWHWHLVMKTPIRDMTAPYNA